RSVSMCMSFGKRGGRHSTAMTPEAAERSAASLSDQDRTTELQHVAPSRIQLIQMIDEGRADVVDSVDLAAAGSPAVGLQEGLAQGAHSSSPFRRAVSSAYQLALGGTGCGLRPRRIDRYGLSPRWADVEIAPGAGKSAHLRPGFSQSPKNSGFAD